PRESQMRPNRNLSPKLGPRAEGEASGKSCPAFWFVQPPAIPPLAQNKRLNKSSARQETTRKTHFPNRSAPECFCGFLKGNSILNRAESLQAIRATPMQSGFVNQWRAHFALPVAPAKPGLASTNLRPYMIRQGQYLPQ